MNCFVSLIPEMIRKRIIIASRYRVNTGAKGLFLVLIFAVVIFGGRAIGGASFEDSIDNVIAGYFLWILATAAFASLSAGLTKEARWGTLEQLYMSVYGFGRVLLAKLISDVVVTFVGAFALFVIFRYTTAQSVSVHVPSFVVVSLLTICSAIGIGLALGGLATLYKKVENVVSLVQFAFIGLISAPNLGPGWVKFLPLAHGSAMVQQLVTTDATLLDFRAGALLFLVCNSLLYVLGGVLVFELCLARAKRRGVLGHY